MTGVAADGRPPERGPGDASDGQAAPGIEPARGGPDPPPEAGPSPVPPDSAWAAATAARGFLFSRWLGAMLMVYSFTHLYVFGLRPGASMRRTFLVALVAMAVGTWMWSRSRTYARRVDVPWRPKWAAAADLFALTAIVFWLLFVVALWLLSRGVDPF